MKLSEPGKFLWNSQVEEGQEAIKRLLDEQSAAIREQNRSLSTFINSLPGGVICCDDSPDLNLVQYSEGFLTMFGYTAQEIEQLYQNHFAFMVHPEDKRHADREVSRQLAQGLTKEIRYRVRCKDGGYIWVLDRGQLVQREDGRNLYYCILIDITETQKAQDALQLSLERHQIIMDQTADIIFEWDIETDSLIFSSNWEKQFGYPPPQDSASIGLGDTNHIHPEDLEHFLKLKHSAAAGQAYTESELRLARQDGSFIWCRLRVTLQFNRDGAPAKAIGVIIDIDKEKRRTQQLKAMAETDTLTGLYNKGASKKRIQRLLRELGASEQCACLFVDVDNFKQVNDLYGHLSGDILLADIAGMLKKQFRESDVIARIGGDEFAVFMKDISGVGIAVKKAQDILSNIACLLDEAKRFRLSCSVGIVMVPQDGQDFETMYRNADIALYHAKTKGKNGFSVYRPEMNGFGTLAGEEAVFYTGAAIDSDRNTDSHAGGLPAYVFRELYQAACVDHAISRVLEIIGKQFDVSRAYVFENDPDDSYCNNTFEWCDQDIPPQIQELQHMLEGTLDDYYKNFSSEGVFYCRDIENLCGEDLAVLKGKGIRSVLQCAIRDNGKIKGFVGFDECRGTRVWTQNQIMTLTMVSEIIGTFLFKQRAQKANR